MDKFIHDLLTEDIVKAALKFYDVINYKDLGGFENFVYEFENANGLFILRLTHSSHRSSQDIKSELDFIYYLAKNNANVAMPIRNKNNNFIETISCADGSYFIVSAFEKAKGVRPTRDLVNNDLLINYGRTIGKFHKLTKNYQPSPGIEKRYSWEEDFIFENIENYLVPEDKIIIDKFNELKAEIMKIPMTNDNYGLIHTDVHFGNFFINNLDICVFDFDDSAYQYFISDIAIALFYYLYFIFDEDKRLAMADNLMTYFMKGYLQEYQLSKDDYLTIDLFLKLREILLYFVIYRCCDIENEEWAQKYINFYRQRIINNTRYVDIDFNKYYHINN